MIRDAWSPVPLLALVGVALCPLVGCDDANPGTGGATSTGATTNTSGNASSGSASSGSASSGDASSSSASASVSTGSGSSAMSFFVSSTGSPTANLGGLAGADKRCQDLAAAVGAGTKTWRAYLSTAAGDARDRIGSGPWYNAKGVMLAADVASLHARKGDHEVFLDENGAMVNGQWAGSPTPNQHDILTGSNADGTLATGLTCGDWTSEDPNQFAQVGHSDGLGPNMNGNPPYDSWNAVHTNGGCNDTAPKGGAGRVYCFAID